MKLSLVLVVSAFLFCNGELDGSNHNTNLPKVESKLDEILNELEEVEDFDENTVMYTSIDREVKSKLADVWNELEEVEDVLDEDNIIYTGFDRENTSNGESNFLQSEATEIDEEYPEDHEVHTGKYKSNLTDFLKTDPSEEELLAFLNITSKGRRLASLSGALASATRAKNSNVGVGSRRSASWEMRNHVRANVVRVMAGTCRRTDGWNCNQDLSPQKTTCGVGFCTADTKGCVLFVGDILLDVVDIMSNFFPPGKALGLVKKVVKIGAKTAVREAKEAAIKKGVQEMAGEMLESIAKTFSKEEVAKSLFTNTGTAQFVWLADRALSTAAEELAIAKIAQDLDYSNPKSSLAKGGLTSEQEAREVYAIMADMDPSGVFSLANKLFLGATCKENKLTEKTCQFGGNPYSTRDANKKCCAGVCTTARRSLRQLDSRKLQRGRGGPSKGASGKPAFGKVQDKYGKDIDYDRWDSTCCNEDGSDGCLGTEGIKLVTYPTDFMDAQLNYPAELGKTSGLYFEIPPTSRTIFQELFDNFDHSTSCHTDWSDLLRRLGCMDENNVYSPQRLEHGKRNACTWTAVEYFERCEINPFGPQGNPHQVRQCRDGKTIWKGKLLMFSNWKGRKFGYEPTSSDWESGDNIVPITHCCPDSGYEPPTPTMSYCSNNPWWAYRMLNCDWVKKNPFRRCDVKSSHGGVAASDTSKGCNKYCRASCRDKPADEPNVGLRIEGYNGWGENFNEYFLIPNGSWALTLWNELELEPAEALASNGQKYDVYDLQHCRNGDQLYTGLMVVYGGNNGKFGRYFENGAQNWLDGDVVIPVGFDYHCKDTVHNLPKGTWQPVTVITPTHPPTNKPTNKPPTHQPTLAPTSDPTKVPTLYPTGAPDNPPYGVRILASTGYSTNARPWPDQNNVLAGNYYCVDYRYRYDTYREMCLDSWLDQDRAGASNPRERITQCRNGEKVWEGLVYAKPNWCTRPVDYSEFQNARFQDGDVIIQSWRGNCADTLIDSGVQRCPRTEPTPSRIATTSPPTRSPTPAPQSSFENTSYQVSFSRTSGVFVYFDADGKQKFESIFNVVFTTDWQGANVKHCRDGTELGNEKWVWFKDNGNYPNGQCQSCSNLESADYFTATNQSCFRNPVTQKVSFSYNQYSTFFCDADQKQNFESIFNVVFTSHYRSTSVKHCRHDGTELGNDRNVWFKDKRYGSTEGKFSCYNCIHMELTDYFTATDQSC